MNPTADDNPLSGKCILCVDDEPLLRDILAMHLQRHAAKVETAPDGMAAWHLVTGNPSRFDVVVTDNQMPHLGGIELVEKLRADGYRGKIIFFSSTLAPQNAERLAGLSVDAVIEKGRPIVELMDALRHAVRN